MRSEQEAFKPLDDYPEARAFWWPRFQRIARWFAGWEIGRRATAAAIYAEIRGEIDVTPDFRLGARADRIERLTDGRYAVLDYKTGQPPTDQGSESRPCAAIDARRRDHPPGRI